MSFIPSPVIFLKIKKKPRSDRRWNMRTINSSPARTPVLSLRRKGFPGQEPPPQRWPPGSWAALPSAGSAGTSARRPAQLPPSPPGRGFAQRAGGGRRCRLPLFRGGTRPAMPSSGARRRHRRFPSAQHPALRAPRAGAPPVGLCGCLSTGETESNTRTSLPGQPHHPALLSQQALERHPKSQRKASLWA